MVSGRLILAEAIFIMSAVPAANYARRIFNIMAKNLFTPRTLKAVIKQSGIPQSEWIKWGNG
ncbi:hypothetical protein A2W54_03645 [Candidatus Giovannonibacteria bacterium RIFCSPHIGHO2_02_43_13]|uniref:Uncharacterized protein n=1 Tax=Candidatus Giovannonibacteria bacterium RIFCSPHIGHO2_02_43_13 TaxID=1798330 RepID=A0A1F5WQD8_9BACT|nr:MAG: hypothetical protein A3E06_00855 [Candidatus Giovannonibacteria bacterium RIFCSPHIGHO2_12_FULL_44_42]OGF77865.1 MAG: hypothetical protein A2W54_03645 [Candidatus Giovannonibacteria bacterium RIFCSPHIGHO2_02_43_13]OGF88798.1 MAG: hypothetical protein A3I94_02210 [Candidatus Giovannonibacteria bacterium RIFCSPLOWO2_02_FULL_43_54]OGF96762.1 MAG: hypothetical protein A3H08_01100 [Candidatus Giovannonibacteria bacterium RIFCSPLOWO2_12_FULL_44_32]